ncbi:MAG TPA: hypothetical protein VJM12_15385 [Pyrinomonadaceae bacterium]|nr:hypothetical protein [Pyrinomonadaceae bacterium]
MTESNATVAIVVDPDFGERLLSLANEMPVWIADTSTNRIIAESLWSRAGSKCDDVSRGWRRCGGVVP